MGKEHLADRLVGHCMSAPPISVDPYATLAEAWSLMRLQQIRRLPVVSHGRLTGIVTRSDVLEAKPSALGNALAFDEVMGRLDSITVGIAMSANPITVYEADTLGRAAELMLEHKIGGLPVISARGELVGVITESDLFRLLAGQWREHNCRLQD